MKILQGKRVRNFEEAAALAFQEAGVGDISAGVADLFVSIADATKLRTEAERSISAAIRDKYRGKPRWQGKWWCVPVPMLSYEAKDIPHLKIESKTYLVALGEVETTDDSYSVTLVGAIGKPETLVIPMVFLQAILDGDLGRFNILAKGGSHTTWEMPGAKPVQLPNDFVNKLAEIFRRKSVAMWLDEFGSQGRSVAPLIVGSLLGLQFQDRAQAVPLGQQPWTTDQLVKAPEGMAYTSSEARELVNRAAPGLRVDYSLEEAIRLVLQQAGKGG
jgi:hypothetical protein